MVSLLFELHYLFDLELHIQLLYSCITRVNLFSLSVSIHTCSTLQGRRAKKSFGGAPAFFPSHPLPSLPSLFSFPPFLSLLSPPPQKQAPLLWIGGLGERFSSPSGSGQSPAAKPYLVNLRQKYCLKQQRSLGAFQEMKHKTGWQSDTVVTYFLLTPDCQRSLQIKLRIDCDYRSRNNSPTLFNRRSGSSYLRDGSPSVWSRGKESPGMQGCICQISTGKGLTLWGKPKAGSR